MEVILDPSPLITQPALELVHLYDKLKAIRAFVLDVDGVLTDNTVLVTEAGEHLRTMHVRDGQAMRWATERGYPICIITGGRSEGVVKRMTMLGIKEVYTGQTDKLPVFQQFLRQYGLSPIEVCYIGDDLPDLPVMRKIGLPACPADAVPEVTAVADYVSPFAGGRGCVRDVIEKVLKLRGDWPTNY
jgi:3-deoxy-D-manno-octulosonate 8-phosphate phosphatase (KDO 8-P phosphatase)